MGEFRDHPSKKFLREQWCKPLLEFIHNTLGYKLIYLGLPGPQALDLLTWIEYIEQVIAFQCRDYPNPSSVSQSKSSIQNLERKLSELERESKIKTFAVYDGYIEEVVLRGRDTIGNYFNQHDVVTIYNLDFCNGITVPLEILDDAGNIQSLYKSEAIRKLLELQRDINSHRRKKFVMFLTIHSRFWFEEGRKFISQTQDADIRTFISSLRKLSGWRREAKLLKAYVYQIIKNFFCHCEFTPEFLPIIYYQGVGDNNWLMLFSFIGSFNKQISGIAPCFQSPKDFLYQKFLTIKGKNITLMPINGVKEVDCPSSLIEAFQISKSYKQLWT
jgi:hypothetical protein